MIDKAYPRAIKEASYEALEGKFSEQELEDKMTPELIKTKAIEILDWET